MDIDFIEIIKNPGTILVLIFGLDLLLGDPDYKFHPIRLIGKTIYYGEGIIRKARLNEKYLGACLVILSLIHI